VGSRCGRVSAALCIKLQATWIRGPPRRIAIRAGLLRPLRQGHDVRRWPRTGRSIAALAPLRRLFGKDQRGGRRRLPGDVIGLNNPGMSPSATLSMWVRR